MTNKFASLKIKGLQDLCPYDRIRLAKWLNKCRKELEKNYKDYEDKCEFGLFK